MPSLFPASHALTVSGAAIPQVAGQAALVPLKLQGSEGINSLFHYTLTLQTPEALGSRGSNLDLVQLAGQEITCHIELEGHGSFRPGHMGTQGLANQGAGQRQISGLVSAARLVRQEARCALYELDIRPWLHIASLSSNCRIFQNMTPIAVIEAVLGVYHYPSQKRLIERYPVRDFCVQYNETNFEFITRLMQEWGISYWFEHHDGSHRLIWSDHNAAFAPTQPGSPSAYHSIPYYPAGQQIDREYIHAFTPSASITSGAYASRDYDYTRPRASLAASARSEHPSNAVHPHEEIYLWRAAKAYLGGSDYSQPNAGSHKDANATEEQGQQLALLRLQALRQDGRRARGSGHLRGIVPGCSFTLCEHPHTAANIEYIVLHTQFLLENVDQSSQSVAGLATLAALGGNSPLSHQWRVEVDFEVQPSTEMLRPAITQPKPCIHGPQPAIVCGPDEGTAENNIYTDHLGRIKIRFLWDRHGPQNQNSSCWVRVASPWAGNQLGMVSLPRVGQEVLVSFMEGDPDLPVVIGSMHNANNLSPWKLPGQQSLTGLRTRETRSGAGNSAAGRSNHLVFDDTAEQIQGQFKSDYAHSQVSVGYITRIEDHGGRKDHRGIGFEVRSDAHGAIRANWGLLITTYGRDAAQGHMMGMQESTQQLGSAYAQHYSMGNLAVHHWAQEQAEVQAVQRSLEQQNAQLAGTGVTAEGVARREGAFPEMQAPYVLLASPAGVVSTTEGSTHQQSAQHHAITAGQHISLSSMGSVLVAAGKRLGVLATQGLRLISAKGKVQIQAQANDMELLAQKVLELVGKQGVNIHSATQIRLTVGPHTIQITPAGGIELVSPMAPKLHTAAMQLETPKSTSQAIQSSPTSNFNDKLVLHDDEGKPYANQAFEITRTDGSVLQATTNGKGELPIQRSDTPENLVLRLIRPQKS